MLVPGAFAIGRDTLTWKKSREYCMNNGNQFACPVTESVHKEMADNLTKEDGDGWDRSAPQFTNYRLVLAGRV